MSDALASLRQALAPKKGMKRIPFSFESYQLPSLPLSAKRLVNLYAEQAPGDARNQVALMSTPGCSLFLTVGTGPIRAMNTDRPGILYVLSGTRFYRVYFPFGGTSYVTEDLGEVGAPAGSDYPNNLMPTIAAGVIAAVVCVPPNAFTCGHNPADPLNQIGGSFPGARSVAYLDGYFVFTSDDIDAQFFSTKLLDAADYNVLDFASADGVPNIVRRVVSLRGDLWFVGDAGVEIWTNTGAADFPFRRQPGGVIPYGSVSVKSVAVLDGSVFWVGYNGVVYRSVGYRAERISTHAIESILTALLPQTVICSLAYNQQGHTFYCVSYAGRTLAYDCATKLWADRESGTGIEWFPLSVAQFGEQVMLGASGSGRILFSEMLRGTEDGVAIRRQVTMPPLWAGTNRAFCSRLEIEMEVGTTPAAGGVVLEWSDDGGRTFPGGPRIMSPGVADATLTRVYATRLGSFRQRVFNIVTSGHVTLYAVDADIVPGAG